MRGTITEEELRKLNAWYNQESADDVVWAGKEGEDEVRERLFESISVKLEAESPRQFRRPHGVLRYLPAAAAVVITIVSLGIFWKAGFFEKAPVVAQAQDPFDLAPGTDGAILILGNGQHIELNKDDRRELGGQGHARVY